MKKKIIITYAAALASVLIGSFLNFIWTQSAVDLPTVLGDFILIRKASDTAWPLYASLGDCFMALGFIIWAYNTGVLVQSGVTFMRKTA